MKKLLLSILTLTLSAGLWAQEKKTVSYLYPVYNTPDEPASGIKEWQTGSVEATVITTTTIALRAGWYVVMGNDVQTTGLVCNGDVHLILADGAKLTTNAVNIDASYGPGICVNESTSSLTIYGQVAQSGQLIAKGKKNDCAGIGGDDYSSSGKITINGGIIEATGYSVESIKDGGAGIGGGGTGRENGSDITINGGIVTATGAVEGAGIGGGCSGRGSNITINGGTVIANGGAGGAGIGGGAGASGSNITINDGMIVATGGYGSYYVGAGIGGGGNAEGSNITINGGNVIASGCLNTDTYLNKISDGIGCGNGGNLTPTNIKVTSTHEVKADNNNPPSTMIENNGSEDLADKLKGRCYVTILPTLETEKSNAISAINAKLEEIDNGNIKGIASIAIASINAATSVAEVNAIKTQALSNIASAQGAYYDGKADAFGDMGTPPLTDCPAVKVTKGDKEVILYAPDAVEMIKIPATTNK